MRMSFEKQLAGLVAAPMTPRLSISPHSDTVTNILDGRPWRSCKQGKKKGGGGSVIHAPLLSKDD